MDRKMTPTKYKRLARELRVGYSELRAGVREIRALLATGRILDREEAEGRMAVLWQDHLKLQDLQRRIHVAVVEKNSHLSPAAAARAATGQGAKILVFAAIAAGCSGGPEDLGPVGHRGLPSVADAGRLEKGDAAALPGQPDLAPPRADVRPLSIDADGADARPVAGDTQGADVTPASIDAGLACAAICNVGCRGGCNHATGTCLPCLTCQCNADNTSCTCLVPGTP